jgi:hypothetical protein
MQILDLKAQYLAVRNAYTSICNLQFETGNPPAAWEPEGEIARFQVSGVRCQKRKTKILKPET